MSRLRGQWGCLLSIAFVCSAFGQVPPGAPPKPEPLPLPSTPLAPPPGGLDLKALPAPVPSTLPGAILVKAFKITGSTVVAESELVAILSPWAGRTLTGEELAQAVQAVTAHLRGKGLLVAQAYVPPQEIRDGVVEIKVIEGRIGEVRLEIAEDARLRRSAVAQFVEPLRSGDTVRRDNVEHSLLLLNDLPGAKLSASLAAGAQPGTADVVAKLENEGNPLRGAFTFDNAGVRGVGEYRAIADLRLASPFELGDLLAARLLQSSEGGQTLGSLTYGLPVNGLGTRLGVRYTEQRYQLGREFAPLQAHGDNHAGSLLASHPLIRRSDHNLSLALSYTELAFHDRQDDVGFVSDSRQRIAGLGLAADQRDGWLGGGATAIQAQYLSGRVLLDTPVLAALDAAPGGLGVNGRFSVLRMRAQRAQVIDATSSLHVSVNGQIASTNLDAGSELAVGGPDAVRAYPVGELYADQGYVARIEYRKALALVGSERTVLSLFFDHARVEVNRDSVAGDTANKRGLSGYGFGLYQSATKDIELQTWFAWKGSKDRPTAAPERSPRIWFSITARI